MTQNEASKQKSILLTYYDRYEYLAERYAKKIYNSYRISLEYDDLLQEFKMKIYLSIIAYGKKWAKYKKEGGYKPMNIKNYICCALNNRAKDFIKEISEMSSCNNISIEENNFDYAVYKDIQSNKDIKNLVFEINGVNLIKGLTLKKAVCFIMYAKGFKFAELGRLFNFDPKTVIEKQIKSLRKNNSIKEIFTNDELIFVKHLSVND